MQLLVAREPTTDDCTLGSLFIDGKFFCFTLEDAVRVGPKVLHETAIPQGRYRVIVNRSQRFGRMLPLVLDVPGFTGIRIHGGNTAVDTSGCILVGLARTQTSVLSSQAAVARLMAMLAPAMASGEDLWLTVMNQPASELPKTA